MSIEIDVNLIADPVVRDSFQKVVEQFEQNPILGGEFKLLNSETLAANSNFKVAHGLGYTPKDVIVTYISNAATVTPKFSETDGTWVTFNVSAACEFRFLVGVL